MLYWWVPCAKNINSLFFAIILMKITWKTWKRKKRLYNLLLKPRTKTSQLNGKSKEDVFRCVLSPKWPFKMVAFENIRFSTLFAARDVSRGGTSSNTQDKWQTRVMQNFEGQIRCIIGNVEVAYKLAIGVNLVRGEFRQFGERKRRVINT